MTKIGGDLSRELAGQATANEELKGVMRSLMKTTIETMRFSEMSVPLGRVRSAVEAKAGTRVDEVNGTGGEGAEDPSA